MFRPRHLALLALACASLSTDAASAAILPAIGGTAAAGVDTPITGLQPGAPVQPAGDVNGDGKADLVVGYNPAQVLLGSASPAPVDVSAGGPRLWSLPDTWTDPNGQPYHVPLTTLGDVNGDGFDDLFAQPDLTGRDLRPAAPGDVLAVIAAGRAGAGGTTTNLGSSSAVSTRFVSSAPGRTYLGSVVAIGDHDGDGFDDFLLEWYVAGGFPTSGATVMYGGPNLAGTVDLNDPAKRGYRVYATPPASVPPGGGTPSDYSYLRSITAVGDVNGDHLSDFAVQRMIVGGKSYAWFVYGNRSRTRGDLDLENRAGRAARVGPVEMASGIVALGDLNADGMDDVAVAPTGSTSAVLRGRTATTDMAISTSFQRINWRLQVTSGPVVPPGDVNGDRIPDVAVYGIDQGKSTSLRFVLFGKSDGRTTIVPPTGTPTTAAVRFGSAFDDDVTNAGDVNGDGRADLIVGSGIVYGYGSGSTPTPDTTAPTFAARLSSSYYVGTCGFFAQKAVIPGTLFVDLSEAANLELVGVQNGVTRRATITAGPGQNVYAYLPKSLVASTLGSVAVTATPVDAAGNRGAPQSVTVPIAKGGYTLTCP